MALLGRSNQRQFCNSRQNNPGFAPEFPPSRDSRKRTHQSRVSRLNFPPSRDSRKSTRQSRVSRLNSRHHAIPERAPTKAAIRAWIPTTTRFQKENHQSRDSRLNPCRYAIPGKKPTGRPKARFTPQQEANSHRGHSSTQLNPTFGPKYPSAFPLKRCRPIRHGKHPGHCFTRIRATGHSAQERRQLERARGRENVVKELVPHRAPRLVPAGGDVVVDDSSKCRRADLHQRGFLRENQPPDAGGQVHPTARSKLSPRPFLNTIEPALRSQSTRHVPF